MLHDSIEDTHSNSVKCELCDKQTRYFIDHVVPIKQVCPKCAHVIMRRLFEDLIQYHNRNNKSKHYSLLNIMYHGEHDIPNED